MLFWVIFNSQSKWSMTFDVYIYIYDQAAELCLWLLPGWVIQLFSPKVSLFEGCITVYVRLCYCQIITVIWFKPFHYTLHLAMTVSELDCGLVEIKITFLCSKFCHVKSLTEDFDGQSHCTLQRCFSLLVLLLEVWDCCLWR